jgi:murein DD-endopeptidase MepM/ murein hydrolase activator NlpD
MKRWTVMLIPHDQSSTRSLRLHSSHIWVAMILATCIFFGVAFLYGRCEVQSEQVDSLRAAYVQLQEKAERQKTPDLLALPSPQTDIEADEVENIRAEYEKRLAVITAELAELYDFEAKIRAIQKLPPRTKDTASYEEGQGGGQGGPPGDFESNAYAVDDPLMLPPSHINGLSDPSADLIAEEINLRTESLQQLMQSMTKQLDLTARTPAIWPCNSPQRRITSQFGWRKDPFNFKLRHHDGIDVAAPLGSDVVATGKGVVSFAGRDQWLGVVVRIDHGNGIETVYGHLQRAVVKVGMQVDRDQVVGEIGMTGRTTGPHVHYEVRIKGKAVDPIRYFGN